MCFLFLCVLVLINFCTAKTSSECGLSFHLFIFLCSYYFTFWLHVVHFPLLVSQFTQIWWLFSQAMYFVCARWFLIIFLVLLILVWLMSLLRVGQAVWKKKKKKPMDSLQSDFIFGIFVFVFQCFGHSWYLANDMQFYILSPLMIVPFYL